MVVDGALGAWAPSREVFPSAGEQRCWFHACGNVIDYLPKRLQRRAKGLLGEIIEAPTRAEARRALAVTARERPDVALVGLGRTVTRSLTRAREVPACRWV